LGVSFGGGIIQMNESSVNAAKVRVDGKGEELIGEI